MKPAGYYVVAQKDLVKLEGKVVELLNYGFQPAGGVFVVSTENETRYLQAMFKPCCFE